MIEKISAAVIRWMRGRWRGRDLKLSIVFAMIAL
jgi:hypothetical protein